MADGKAFDHPHAEVTVEHEPRQLSLDMEKLTLAMEDATRAYNEYYLNTETGEVVVLPIELVHAVEDPDWETEKKNLPAWEQSLAAIAEEIYLDEAERWVLIPAIPTREAYQHMCQFAETVTDTRLRELLEVALGGQGAFRRFKDVLARFPAERQRWYAFKDALVREWALDWLRSIGIEPRPGAKAERGTPAESHDKI